MIFVADVCQVKNLRKHATKEQWYAEVKEAYSDASLPISFKSYPEIVLDKVCRFEATCDLSSWQGKTFFNVTNFVQK